MAVILSRGRGVQEVFLQNVNKSRCVVRQSMVLNKTINVTDFSGRAHTQILHFTFRLPHDVVHHYKWSVTINLKIDIRENLKLTWQWRHNGRDGVSNHQPHDCLLNRSFKRRPKKISKIRFTGFWEGNSPLTSEFPTQRASNAENVSIWWRHHEIELCN